MTALKLILVLCLLALMPAVASAHHTLGVNQSGKATESPQIPMDQQIRVGDYLFSVTVMPARPRPQTLTRVIVYTKNLASGRPFLGEMRFRIDEKYWYRADKTLIDSVQHPIDDRFIQIVEFQKVGGHVIQLGLREKGRSYWASFSLDVGSPNRSGKFLLGLAVAAGVVWITWKARRNRRRLRPV